MIFIRPVCSQIIVKLILCIRYGKIECRIFLLLEVEKADGETAFNADNSSITKSAGVEVTNTTDPNTNTNTVIDMDTDSLTVDHTGTICSSLTENEITVQN